MLEAEEQEMASDILVTENKDISIRRDFGFVTASGASDRIEVIEKLKANALKMGANAVILLCVSKLDTDPYFKTYTIYARGIAVEV